MIGSLIGSMFCAITSARLALSQGGYTTADLLELIRRAGFRVFRIEHPGLLSLVSGDFDSERFKNLVALRDPPEFAQRSGWKVGVGE